MSPPFVNLAGLPTVGRVSKRCLTRSLRARFRVTRVRGTGGCSCCFFLPHSFTGAPPFTHSRLSLPLAGAPSFPLLALLRRPSCFFDRYFNQTTNAIRVSHRN